MVNERGYLRVEGLQIHYRAAGPVTGRPVMLFHQSPSSSLMYERVLPVLGAAGLRAVAIDTPGFGMSDPPAEQPEIEDYCRWAGGAIAALGWEHAALVGFHTGATICWELAGSRPDLVTRLAVSGAGLYSVEERAQFQARVPLERERAIPLEDGSHLQRAFQNRKRVSDTETWIIQQEVVQSLVAGPNAWWGHRAAFAYDVTPRVETVTQPILIVTNTGDMLYPQALRTAERRPDAALVVLEGGTLDIVNERPEMWAAALVPFLTASEAR